LFFLTREVHEVCQGVRKRSGKGVLWGKREEDSFVHARFFPMEPVLRSEEAGVLDGSRRKIIVVALRPRGGNQKNFASEFRRNAYIFRLLSPPASARGGKKVQLFQKIVVHLGLFAFPGGKAKFGGEGTRSRFL